MNGKKANPSCALIKLNEVTKVYGAGEAAVHALAGVSLNVHHGEFVAVMGPSGSGKSTCMNIIGCLDAPTAGTYWFEGVDVGALTREQCARLRRTYLGFVFQGFNLLARTSALENVALPLLYRGASAQERHAQAKRALEMVGLSGREHHSTNELSGGQQQRVAIARAIVTAPRLLLADEPTGNLDSKTSGDIMDLIVRLNTEQAITVMMVTHDQDMANYARRLIRFVDGKVVSDQIRSEAA